MEGKSPPRRGRIFQILSIFVAGFFVAGSTQLQLSPHADVTAEPRPKPLSFTTTLDTCARYAVSSWIHAPL